MFEFLIHGLYYRSSNAKTSREIISQGKKGFVRKKIYIGDQEREDKTQNNSQHYQNGSLFWQNDVVNYSNLQRARFEIGYVKGRTHCHDQLA